MTACRGRIEKKHGFLICASNVNLPFRTTTVSRCSSFAGIASIAPHCTISVSFVSPSIRPDMTGRRVQEAVAAARRSRGSSFFIVRRVFSSIVKIVKKVRFAVSVLINC